MGRNVLVVLGVLAVLGAIYAVVLGSWFLVTGGHHHHHGKAPVVVTTTG